MSGSLNHSQADIIQQLLVDAALGTLPEDSGVWPIFSTYERDDPDNVITVYNTSPIVQGRLHVTGETQQHYGIQIRIRAAREITAYNKANEITEEFDNVTRRQVNPTVTTGTGGTDEYLVQAIHHAGILSIGEDPTGRRRLFTINAITSIRQIN